MNDVFRKRVKSAAIAGWWTALIAWLVMLFSWGVWEVILHTQPAWMLWWFGGGELEWLTIQKLCLTIFGAFKIGLILMVTVVIWLSFWARGLKRSE